MGGTSNKNHKPKNMKKLILASVLACAIGAGAQTNTAPAPAMTLTTRWERQTNEVEQLVDTTTGKAVDARFARAFNEPTRFEHSITAITVSNLWTDTVFEGRTNSVLMKVVEVSRTNYVWKLEKKIRPSAKP